MFNLEKLHLKFELKFYGHWQFAFSFKLKRLYIDNETWG